MNKHYRTPNAPGIAPVEVEVKAVQPVDGSIETTEVDGESIEVVNHVVTEQTIELNPEMTELGIEVGDVIQYAATEEGDAKLTESIATEEPATEEVKPAKEKKAKAPKKSEE